MDRITELLEKSYRPLIWAGNGIRLSGERGRFRDFVQRTQIPFVTTWTGADLIPTDHPLNIGIVGVSGQRGANKAVQECDFLLVLGSHLSIPQTSTLTDQFAPQAKKIVVDIDQDELDHLNVDVDLKICADLRDFFDWGQSLNYCSRLEQWEMDSGYLKTLNKPPSIGSYLFNDKMTRMLPPGVCMVIDGGGTALYTGFQSSHVKEGSRLVCSTAISAMGSGLPEAVGACLAAGKRLTTCLIGDGSLMFNLQELQTIQHLKLPIKVFVLNNQGYLAIKHTQDGFLEGRHHGVGEPDLSLPRLSLVASCFGLKFARLTDPYDEEIIGLILDDPEPVLCEVVTPSDQKMLRQAFNKNLSEMVF